MLWVYQWKPPALDSQLSLTGRNTSRLDPKWRLSIKAHMSFSKMSDMAKIRCSIWNKIQFKYLPEILLAAWYQDSQIGAQKNILDIHHFQDIFEGN